MDGPSSFRDAPMPAWIPCPCDEYWCTVHRRHAFECDCPPIEQWTTDPYSEDEPMPRKKTETAMPTIEAPNGVSFTMYCRLEDKEELTALARELGGSRADALRYALSAVREQKQKKSPRSS